MTAWRRKELSQRERRPVRVIVEEALVQYSKSRSHESAQQFLSRLKRLAVDDVDLSAMVEDSHVPHDGPVL